MSASRRLSLKNDGSVDADEVQPTIKESEPLTSEEWDNILGNDWRPAQRDQIGAGDEEFPFI